MNDLQVDLAALSTSEAAKVAGVAAKTLQDWRGLGFGPAFIKLGRRVVYDVRDIQAWKDGRRLHLTSEASVAG